MKLHVVFLQTSERCDESISTVQLYNVVVRIIMRWEPLLLLDEESVHVRTHQEAPGNL